MNDPDVQEIDIEKKEGNQWALLSHWHVVLFPSRGQTCVELVVSVLCRNIFLY